MSGFDALLSLQAGDLVRFSILVIGSLSVLSWGIYAMIIIFTIVKNGFTLPFTGKIEVSEIVQLIFPLLAGPAMAALIYPVYEIFIVLRDNPAKAEYLNTIATTREAIIGLSAQDSSFMAIFSNINLPVLFARGFYNLTELLFLIMDWLTDFIMIFMMVIWISLMALMVPFTAIRKMPYFTGHLTFGASLLLWPIIDWIFTTMLLEMVLGTMKDSSLELVKSLNESGAGFMSKRNANISLITDFYLVSGACNVALVAGLFISPVLAATIIMGRGQLISAVPGMMAAQSAIQTGLKKGAGGTGNLATGSVAAISKQGAGVKAFSSELKQLGQILKGKGNQPSTTALDAGDAQTGKGLSNAVMGENSQPSTTPSTTPEDTAKNDVSGSGEKSKKKGANRWDGKTANEKKRAAIANYRQGKARKTRV